MKEKGGGQKEGEAKRRDDVTNEEGGGRKEERTLAHPFNYFFEGIYHRVEDRGFKAIHDRRNSLLDP